MLLDMCCNFQWWRELWLLFFCITAPPLPLLSHFEDSPPKLFVRPALGRCRLVGVVDSSDRTLDVYRWLFLCRPRPNDWARVQPETSLSTPEDLQLKFEGRRGTVCVPSPTVHWICNHTLQPPTDIRAVSARPGIDSTWILHPHPHPLDITEPESWRPLILMVSKGVACTTQPQHLCKVFARNLPAELGWVTAHLLKPLPVQNPLLLKRQTKNKPGVLIGVGPRVPLGSVFTGAVIDNMRKTASNLHGDKFLCRWREVVSLYDLDS